MAKLSKEDFKSKYSEVFKDNDEILIGLLEDVEDSFEAPSEELESLKTELEKSKNDFNDLKEKYKQRFLTPAEAKAEDEKLKKDKFDEPEERKVFDVKIEDL